jgi:uncharacterized damage-inducible protein DinB
MSLTDQMLDTWVIHNRILIHLLDNIPEEALSGLSASGGRSVGQMFAHIHNVRLMWLEVSAPDLFKTQSKVPARKKDEFSTAQLRSALESSAQVMQEFLRRGFESGKLKEIKPHPGAGFGYFIGHEWYHIGEIGITLTQAGFPLDDKVAYGIWEWKKFAT